MTRGWVPASSPLAASRSTLGQDWDSCMRRIAVLAISLLLGYILWGPIMEWGSIRGGSSMRVTRWGALGFVEVSRWRAEYGPAGTVEGETVGFSWPMLLAT